MVKKVPESPKVAFAYKNQDYGSAFGGTLSTPAASNGSVPEVNQLYLGRKSNNKFKAITCTFSRLSYYSTRLSDDALEALTE